MNWNQKEKKQVDRSMLEWMLQFLFPAGKGTIEGYTIVEKPSQVQEVPSTFTDDEKKKIRSWLKGKE